MKTAKKRTPHLSKRAMDATVSCIKNKGNVLLLVNRKGYSILQCADCNSIETCPECNIPLVYHKDKSLLKCHYADMPVTQQTYAKGVRAHGSR